MFAWVRSTGSILNALGRDSFVRAFLVTLLLIVIAALIGWFLGGFSPSQNTGGTTPEIPSEVGGVGGTIIVALLVAIAIAMATGKIKIPSISWPGLPTGIPGGMNLFKSLPVVLIGGWAAIVLLLWQGYPETFAAMQQSPLFWVAPVFLLIAGVLAMTNWLGRVIGVVIGVLVLGSFLPESGPETPQTAQIQRKPDTPKEFDFCWKKTPGNMNTHGEPNAHCVAIRIERDDSVELVMNGYHNGDWKGFVFGWNRIMKDAGDWRKVNCTDPKCRGQWFLEKTSSGYVGWITDELGQQAPAWLQPRQS